MIQIAFGGQVAEELFFGDVSTGPAGDLAYATQVAAQMVGAAGMAGSLDLLRGGAGRGARRHRPGRQGARRRRRAASAVEALLDEQKAVVRELLGAQPAPGRGPARRAARARGAHRLGDHRRARGRRRRSAPGTPDWSTCGSRRPPDRLTGPRTLAGWQFPVRDTAATRSAAAGRSMMTENSGSGSSRYDGRAGAAVPRPPPTWSCSLARHHAGAARRFFSPAGPRVGGHLILPIGLLSRSSCTRCRACRGCSLTGTRAGTLTPLVGWALVVLPLPSGTAQGDVILPGTLTSIAYLLVGAATYGVRGGLHPTDPRPRCRPGALSCRRDQRTPGVD